MYCIVDIISNRQPFLTQFSKHSFNKYIASYLHFIIVSPAAPWVRSTIHCPSWSSVPIDRNTEDKLNAAILKALWCHLLNLQWNNSCQAMWPEVDIVPALQHFCDIFTTDQLHSRGQPFDEIALHIPMSVTSERPQEEQIAGLSTWYLCMQKYRCCGYPNCVAICIIRNMPFTSKSLAVHNIFYFRMTVSRKICLMWMGNDQ